MSVKLFKLVSKIRHWQPKPYLGYSNDNIPASWWFYRKVQEIEDTFLIETNSLGKIWDRFWSVPYNFLIGKLKKGKIK